jgi:hypothetical protein
MRPQARPPTAIKRASLPSSPALLPHLYISHKSTYGQRYLPSPPRPLSRTAGEGVNVDVEAISFNLSEFCALKDTPAMLYDISPFAANTTFG